MSNKKDDVLLRRALGDYYTSSGDGVAAQPSPSESRIERVADQVFVLLISASRVLRVYRVGKKGVLKALKRIPQELRHHIAKRRAW
ncbi:hypothetical protein [Carnimonas bestiolae]|uniref:hypothetical protein n=1 Tax=Carnimonas bestiolae TaxID=3402172 RepID=UPI003EDBF746